MSKRKVKLMKEDGVDPEKKRRVVSGASTSQSSGMGSHGSETVEYKCVFRKCKFNSNKEVDMRAHLMRSHKYKRYVYTCKHCEEGERVENDIKAHISRVHPGLSVEYFVEEDENQIDSLLVKCRRSTGTNCSDNERNMANQADVNFQQSDIAGGSSDSPFADSMEMSGNDDIDTRMAYQNDGDENSPRPTSSLSEYAGDSSTNCDPPTGSHFDGNGCFIDAEGYWRCRYCTFKTRGSNITWHIRKHHSQKQFGCGYCSERQNLRADIMRHIERTHPGKDIKIMDLLGGETEPTSSEMSRGSSDIPSAAGSIQASLTAADSPAFRVKRPASTDQQPSSSSFKQKAVKRRGSTKNTQKYITDSHGFHRCILCDFKTSGNILWHIRTRHGKKNLKCGWCEFRHNFMYFVELHSDKTHPGWEVIILDESTGRQCHGSRNSGSTSEKSGNARRKSRVARDGSDTVSAGPSLGEINGDQSERSIDDEVGNSDDGFFAAPGIARSKKECYRDNGDWVCVHCGFRSKGHLRWHILKEHRGKTHRCGYCNYQRYVKYEIIRHIKNRHPGGDIKNILYIQGGESDESTVTSSVLGSPQHSVPQRVEQEMIPAPVSTKNLQYEQMVPAALIDSSKIVRNSDGLLVCPSCPYRNKHTTNMRDHLATKHGIYRAQCGHCDFKAAYVARINIHCKRQHPSLPCRVIELDEGTGSPASKPSARKAVASNIKKKALNASSKLASRFKPAANVPVNKSVKKTVQNELRVTATPPPDEVSYYPDDLSPGHTKAVAEYFTISTTANMQEQFHCRMCPFKTKVRQTIYTHRYIHEPEAFQCPYCGVKRKPPRSTMTLHLRRRHPNKPPHVIDLRQAARRIGNRSDRTSGTTHASTVPEVSAGGYENALKYETDDLEAASNNEGIDLTLNGESSDETYFENDAFINNTYEGTRNMSETGSNMRQLSTGDAQRRTAKSKAKGHSKVLLGKIKIMKPKTNTAAPNSNNKAKTPKGSKTVYRCSFEGCVFEGRDRPTMRVHLFTHLNYSPYQCFYCKIHKRQVAHIKFHLAREHPGIESKHIYDNNERIESELERLLDECTTVLDGGDAEVAPETPIMSRLKLSKNIEVYEECPHCTFRTKSKDLYRHIESAHKEKKYRCQVCSYEALFPSYVRRHCKPRHPETECVVVRIADGKVIPPLELETTAQKADAQNGSIASTDADRRTDSPKNLKLQISEVAKLVKKAAGNVSSKDTMEPDRVKIEQEDPPEVDTTAVGEVEQPGAKQATDNSEDEVEKFKNMLYKNIIRSGMDFRAETPADGNCFFHAVSDQLKRLNLAEKNASELRDMLMEYLRNLPKDQQEFYQDFVEDEEFEEYIESISRDGMYADHLAVEMMAKMLNRKFHIVTSSPDGQQSDIIETLINEEAAEQGPPVLLGHYYEYHYQSLDVAKLETVITTEAKSPSREISPDRTINNSTVFQCMYCDFSGKLRRGVIDHSLKAHPGLPDVEPLVVEDKPSQGHEQPQASHISAPQ